MAVNPRVAASPRNCSMVKRNLRPQLGYCQVLPGRFCGWTSQSQWKPLFDFGAGVKPRVADRVVVSGDFRDYITVFPDRLFSPVNGATRQGVLHQFTPMFSVGYSF